MNVKSAYITTKGAASLPYTPRLPLFNGGIISMGQRPDAIVEVRNLDSFHNCTSTGATIDTYSAYFLDRIPIWYHDPGANLWRVNRGHSGVWQGLPQYGEGWSYEQTSGEPVSVTATVGEASADTTLFASKDGQGYFTFNASGYEPQTLATYIAYQGAGESGYFTWGAGDITAKLDAEGASYHAGTTVPMVKNEIPLEGRDRSGQRYSDLQYFAINDFFGVSDDVFIKYGNIWETSRDRAVNAKSYLYIPLVRTVGYAKLKAKCRVYQTDIHPSATYNKVGIGVGAVVDGTMEQKFQESDSTNWVELTVDYSDLPYIDYLILYGWLGALGIKDVALTIS